VSGGLGRAAAVVLVFLLLVLFAHILLVLT
jgi:hypothetical protein